MQIQPITTLFDDFNGSVLDESRWRVESDLNTGPADPNASYSVSGGAITLNQVSTTSYVLISKDSFIWEGTTLVIGPMSGEFIMGVNGGRVRVDSGVLYADGPFPGSGTNVPYNPATMKYFKVVTEPWSDSLHYAPGTLYYSPNNHDWTEVGTYESWTQGVTSQLRISTAGANKSFTMGAVNPLPNASPIAGILEPADLSVLDTSTPTLSFEAIDPDQDDITYQLQISTTKAFDDIITDVLSASGTGFSAGDPYDNGSTVTYTVQTPLTSGGLSYYWRVRAKDPLGKNEWGAWSPVYAMISEPNPPEVSSTSVATITPTGAAVSGEVTADGGGTILERGIVYSTTVNPTIADGKQVSPGSIGTFSVPLSGLDPNTVYNWRAYATNSKTTSYGDNMTFTTLPGTATINSVTDITDTTAIVNSTILTDGGAPITERGVVYSTVAGPTLANSSVASGSGAGTYETTIEGLTGNSDYYVRAYASNESGTSYSMQTQLTTLQTPSAPTVFTGTSSDIDEVTASVNGSTVTLDGTEPVTERGIVISSTTDDPTIADRKIPASGDGLGEFDVDITQLQPETKYYARAYATNSLGTGYGSVVTFTTLALFIPDEGDGYWTYRPYGSSVTISRSQSTPTYASANLLLSDLNLEDGEVYTLHYSGKESDAGEPTMILQWYDDFVKMQEVIEPNTPYTFTYDKTKLSWAIRLYVTGAEADAGTLNVAFNDMYLAKEAEFSGFIPFVRKGLTEVKLNNNWLLDKRREDTIDTVFSAIDGLGWREFSIKTTGLGWFEVGDQITVQEEDGAKTAIIWENVLTMDGGIKENISSEAPAETETDYNKASSVTKSIQRTQISVDHNEQEIQSLVYDIHDENGVVSERFSEVIQDIEGVRTIVESSGGVNLVKNSVMYEADDDGNPKHWDVTGPGTLLIQASPESLSAGGLSGNVFTLSDKTVSQSVPVLKNVDFISQGATQYYTFSARVRKNTVGSAYITLTNSQTGIEEEEHVYLLPDQQEFYWESISMTKLLPLDDHYVLTIYSDADANLQVTDVMLSPGETLLQWQQASTEAMNTNVAITVDGMTIRSDVFRNDYTRIDALGFEVHKHEAGGERVFGFNGDETNVRKLRADNQISLAPIRMVPIKYDSYEGIAFTRTEDNE